MPPWQCIAAALYCAHNSMLGAAASGCSPPMLAHAQSCPDPSLSTSSVQSYLLAIGAIAPYPLRRLKPWPVARRRFMSSRQQ